MLEGKSVNLRVVEKEDLPLLLGWRNDWGLEFEDRYNPVASQQSLTEFERKYEKLGPDEKWFFIEEKDGTRIGYIGTHLYNSLEIGYSLTPSKRGKGYCTDAVQIMVDYLFLSKNLVRIQAATHLENRASQRVLEKAGFHKEGVARKGMFVRGNWTDVSFYSILREEWKKPKILTRAA